MTTSIPLDTPVFNSKYLCLRRLLLLLLRVPPFHPLSLIFIPDDCDFYDSSSIRVYFYVIFSSLTFLFSSFSFPKNLSKAVDRILDNGNVLDEFELARVSKDFQYPSRLN